MARSVSSGTLSLFCIFVSLVVLDFSPTASSSNTRLDQIGGKGGPKVWLQVFVAGRVQCRLGQVLLSMFPRFVVSH